MTMNDFHTCLNYRDVPLTMLLYTFEDLHHPEPNPDCNLIALIWTVLATLILHHQHYIDPHEEIKFQRLKAGNAPLVYVSVLVVTHICYYTLLWVVCFFFHTTNEPYQHPLGSRPRLSFSEGLGTVV